MLPTTFSALIIFMFAMLPGLPGETVYKLFADAHWQEREWWSILRILSFSATSLALYVIIANIIHLPMPMYIFPSTFNTSNFTMDILSVLSLSFIGHTIVSVIIGISASYGRQILAQLAPVSARRLSDLLNRHFFTITIAKPISAARTSMRKKFSCNVSLPDVKTPLRAP